MPMTTTATVCGICDVSRAHYAFHFGFVFLLIFLFWFYVCGICRDTQRHTRAWIALLVTLRSHRFCAVATVVAVDVGVADATAASDRVQRVDKLIDDIRLGLPGIRTGSGAECTGFLRTTISSHFCWNVGTLNVAIRKIPSRVLGK